MGKLEAQVENYLIEQVEKHGGFTRKIVYQGRKDAPDRLVVLPGGYVVFCECKAPGGPLRSSQELEAQEFYKRDAQYRIIDSKGAVDNLLRLYDLWCKCNARNGPC